MGRKEFDPWDVRSHLPEPATKRQIAIIVLVLILFAGLFGWAVGMALGGVVDVAKQITIDFEASDGMK